MSLPLRGCSRTRQLRGETIFRTDRQRQALLGMRDLHLVLGVAGADLALTVAGLAGGGTEGNPLFAPLTGSTAGIVGGIVFYAVVLCTLGWVLQGPVRRVLASVAFGMHAGAAPTWLAFLFPAAFGWYSAWWLLLLGTASTALFYTGYTYDLYGRYVEPVQDVYRS